MSFRASKSGSMNLRSASAVEILEARIAPAAVFLSSKSASYVDADGDLVTVTFTKNILVSGASGNVDSVFVENGAGLEKIDLTGIDGAAGTGISFKVTLAGNGDGFANVGSIDASNLDLGAIKVRGDLGAIDAGTGQAGKTGLASLSVGSMGAFGLATGAPDLVSNILGNVGAITMFSDLREAQLDISGGLKVLSVGGSVIGGTIGRSGSISAFSIGSVKIGGDLRGGSAAESGMIEALTTMGGVTIGGSILGGTGGDSGEVISFGNMGAVKVGGDVIGGSGTAAFSGVIDSHGTIASVTIGGSLIGGTGPDSGEIVAFGSSIGPVKIGHDVIGGKGANAAPFSGVIDSHGSLKSVTIGGSMIGGSNNFSGAIVADGDGGSIQIAGNVTGGAGTSSATIQIDGKVASLTIGGSLVGGTGMRSAELMIGGDLGSVKIGGDVRGGDGGSNSAEIRSGGVLKSLTIGGSVIGGSGLKGAETYAELGIGSVKIGGDLRGGSAEDAGEIFSRGPIGSVTIGGTVMGGNASFTGNIHSTVSIGSVVIGGDLIGGNNPTAASVFLSGAIDAPLIKSVTITGSVIAGAATSTGALFESGAIVAASGIGSVNVGGSLIGKATNFVTILASGQDQSGSAITAIGSVTVGGRVEMAQILGGYEIGATVNATNPDARIGSVKVGGDWITSRLAAGTMTGTDQAAGTDDDTLSPAGGTPNLHSEIASIAVGGQVRGTFGGTDSYRFMAEKIGLVKVGGATIPIVATDLQPLGITGDFHIVGSASVATPAAPTFAPAHFVNEQTATYTDADGDLVTVKFSKKILTDGAAGNVSTILVQTNGFLRTIDLTGLGADAEGVGISVTAQRAGNGDGFASVGSIQSTANLGAISIRGDLGSVDAGTGALGAVAVQSLAVASMGAFGLTTGATDLTSNWSGGAGKVTVQTDFRGALLDVAGPVSSLTIGGSILGGGTNSSGRISADGIGSVKIGGDLVGGAGTASGLLESRTTAKLGAVTIGGSIRGGTGGFSGELTSGGDLASVKIGGSVIGGTGTAQFSGVVIAGGNLGPVTVGGSLIGGAGPDSGEIEAIGESLGAVKIAHDIRGGTGLATAEVAGAVRSNGTIASVTVGGSIFGGTNKFSGIFADGLGPVKVSHDLRAGSGGATASIASTQNIVSLFIGGSFIGGSAEFDGQITAAGGIGSTIIVGDVVGGSAPNAAIIAAGNGPLISVTIGGSLRGGSESRAGGVFAASTDADDPNSGVIFSVKVGGDVIGGTGSESGSIFPDYDLLKATIGGSVRGGTESFSGRVGAGYSIGDLKIGGSLIGGSASLSGVIDAVGVISNDQISDGFIDSITIGGSVRSGSAARSGFITTGTSLGSLTVAGDLVGRAGAPVIVAIKGVAAPVGTSDLVLKTLKIGRSMEFANVLAGFDFNLQPFDSHAQIGGVTVGRDWIATNVVAGRQNLGTDDLPGGTGTAADNVNFGDLHDALIGVPGTIVAKIASITIGGHVRGSALPDDHFGFVAGEIGAFKLGGTTIPVAGTVDRPIGITADTRLHELQIQNS